ncbi:hypothetical protein R3I93_021404 [Phoxinus phoxinus]|uniref:Uncharacterized protein n=1 Tax=Phoxinus phoxinus TaxID=58324 RepID=A0AAN9C8I0_9TELE
MRDDIKHGCSIQSVQHTLSLESRNREPETGHQR